MQLSPDPHASRWIGYSKLYVYFVLIRALEDSNVTTPVHKRMLRNSNVRSFGSIRIQIHNIQIFYAGAQCI